MNDYPEFLVMSNRTLCDDELFSICTSHTHLLSTSDAVNITEEMNF